MRFTLTATAPPPNPPPPPPPTTHSVPINWAYNHHYEVWMAGKDAEFAVVPADGPNDPMAHGAPTKVIARDLPSAKGRLNNYPTSQFFSEGAFACRGRRAEHGW
jgi:hypothetical protein